MPTQGAPVTPTYGQPASQASNITLTNPNGASTPMTMSGGRYLWDANFTGTSLVLEALGSDGATWRTVATLNASGTFASPIEIGNAASIRVRAPTGATNVYSRLSRVS